MSGKPFSLSDFVNDLIEGLPGPDLSWDFRIDATPSRFTIKIPIKLYGEHKERTRSRVLDTAKKFGFEVSSLYLQSDHDFLLTRDFSDITAK